MRMELIQPFISAADAVFAESLQAPTNIVDLSMDEDAYRRKGVAALVAIKGDIEGRVILDLSQEVAMKVASQLAGSEVEASEQVVKETVCEMANMVIGNSVTLLNDQGQRTQRCPGARLSDWSSKMGRIPPHPRCFRKTENVASTYLLCFSTSGTPMASLPSVFVSVASKGLTGLAC